MKTVSNPLVDATTVLLQDGVDCCLRSEGLQMRRKNNGAKRDRFGLALSLIVQTSLAKHGVANQAKMVELIAELNTEDGDV